MPKASYAINGPRNIMTSKKRWSGISGQKIGFKRRCFIFSFTIRGYLGFKDAFALFVEPKSLK
jgi:hypothetical protein